MFWLCAVIATHESDSPPSLWKIAGFCWDTQAYLQMPIPIRAEELLKSHVQNLPEILPFVGQTYIYIYICITYMYMFIVNICLYMFISYVIIHVYVDKLVYTIYLSIHAYVYTNMDGIYLPKDFKHGYTFRWLGAIL